MTETHAVPICKLDFENRQTWHKLPRWVFRGRMLTPTEKALVIALLDAWDSVGQPTWFYASNQDLATLAGLSKQTLLSVRRTLIKKLLIQTKVGHRHLATRYSLAHDLITRLLRTSPLKTTSLVGVPDLDYQLNGGSLKLDHQDLGRR